MKNRDDLYDECLGKYARRPPKKFLQMDAFYMPNGGDSIRPDADGDCIIQLEVHELMRGADTARVLIPATSTPERAARALRKIAGWLEEDGERIFLGLTRAVKEQLTDAEARERADLPFCTPPTGDRPMTEQQLLAELCKTSEWIAEAFRAEASDPGSNYVGHMVHNHIPHLASLAEEYAISRDARASEHRHRRSGSSANVVAFPEPAGDGLGRARGRFWRHPNDRPFVESEQQFDDVPF